MKFSHKKPEVFDRCVKEFGADWENVVITVGDTVYSKYPISDDLKVHEGVHVKQQTAMGADIWWKRYFADPSFRLSQELEAYKEQLGFIRFAMKGKERHFYEQHIYSSLVKNYGGVVKTVREAKQLLI